MPDRSALKPQKAWEACRTIHLPALSHTADTMAVEKAISEADGIIQLQINLGQKRLKVLYNTTITNFLTISELLEDIGFPPDDSRWNRFKASWYVYLDENARNNARAPAPPCCNKPPK